MPINSISRKAFLRYLALLGLPVPSTLDSLAGSIFQPPDGDGLKFDCTLWYIRPMDLLDLEIGFVNLTVKGQQLIKKAPGLSYFMVVRLPQLHIAEETRNDKEDISDDTLNKGFLSSPSYLVFKFKESSLPKFRIDQHLLAWNSTTFYSLSSVTGKEYPFVTVNYETQGITKGLALNKTGDPLTTIEVPAAIPLVLYGDTGSYVLERDNLSEMPDPYSLPGNNKTENWLAERFKHFLNPTYDKHAPPPVNEIYTEMWYNGLRPVKKSARLLFKVAGFNKNFTNNPYLLPNKEDKRLLYKQFMPGEKKDGDGLSPESRQPAILAKQLISGVGNWFRFSATGFIGNLEYISPDEAAILQKYLHQIRFGRDQYVEVHRLMHCFPKPLRVVEVMIGRRLIKNGVSYVERRKYILVLDKLLPFRSFEDQDTNALAQSVLQRVVDHPQKDIVNYVRSCKRSIPFQQVEVLTEGFIEITDFEDNINQKITATTADLRIRYAGALKDPMARLVPFLKECKAQREVIRANALLHDAVGEDILELCGQVDNADIVSQEFPGIIALIPVLKLKLRKIATLIESATDTGLTRLAANAGQLADTLDTLNDTTVKAMQDAINDAVPTAVQAINSVTDAKGRPQHDIVDFRTDSYRKIRAYWPKQKNAPTMPVLFSFRYTDWNGNTEVYSCPLILVSGESVLEVGEQAAKKRQLSTTIPVDVDKEILYEQQYCLDMCQYFTSRWDRIKSLAAQPAYITDEFTRRYTDLLEQAYTTAEALMNDATAEQQALFKRILEMRTSKAEDVQRVYEQLKGEIATLDAKLKDKAGYLMYTTRLLNIFDPLKSGAAAVIDRFTGIAGALQKDCNKWIGAANAALAAQWFEANRKLNALDQQIMRNYHSAENEYRRQIQMGQQKISYYRDKVAETVDSKIHDLTTEMMELTAIPIARMAELRQQVADIVPDGTAEYERMAEFVRRFGISYTQMVTAKVLAPLYDQVTNAPTIFLSYAAPYKMAGIEGWAAAGDELEKKKRNAEQILFEIQQPLNTATAAVNDAINTLQGMHAELIAQGNGMILEGANSWRSFKNTVHDFETGTIGYVHGSLEGALKGAHDKLGGIMDPGVVTDQVSAVKGMAYTLNNRVNLYKGELERYSTAANNYVQQTTVTLNDFKNNVKAYPLDLKNKVVDQIKDIKLFNISLASLLKGLDTYAPKDLPGSTVQIKKNGLIPVELTASYCWSPGRNDLFDDGKGTIYLINTQKRAAISVCMTNTTSLQHPRTNRMNSNITVSGFGVSAMGIVTIHFDSISYEKEILSKWDSEKDDWSVSSSYSHVNIRIAKVDFSGFLELVKQLQEKLGLGDGFLLDVSTSGIQLSYGIRIPAISTGGFTMSNMNLYAGMILSFQGKSPQFRFSFGERHNPFTLAVGIYAGRGFFGMNVSGDGVELLEAALEFGAYLSLDLLGIAKGQAYLMAGIYFRSTKDQGVFVESYITCGGSLSVIGLIQVSVVFYLSLSYQDKDKSLKGRASVEVSVKVLFFSASYNLTFEKQITGGGVAIIDPMDQRIPMYASNLQTHGPNNGEEMDWTDESFDDDSDKVYRYLKIVDEDDPNKKYYVPINDPVVLYGHSMDFDKYIEQFAK